MILLRGKAESGGAKCKVRGSNEPRPPSAFLLCSPHLALFALRSPAPRDQPTHTDTSSSPESTTPPASSGPRAIRDWEPHLDLIVTRDDARIYEPDGTLAVALAPATASWPVTRSGHSAEVT